MTRNDVYSAIDSEREYQIKMTADPSRPDMIENFGLGDAISAIQHNLNLAGEEWYVGSHPHQKAMAYLRKIAGICVKMGEQNGMPSR